MAFEMKVGAYNTLFQFLLRMMALHIHIAQFLSSFFSNQPMPTSHAFNPKGYFFNFVVIHSALLARSILSTPFLFPLRLLHHDKESGAAK